jgi:SAM-dependent methyltransferase
MVSQDLWAEPDVRRRWEQLVKLLAPLPGDSILDVGHGPGLSARYLASIVTPTGRVTALDPSPRSTKQLRVQVEEQGLRNLVVVRAQAESIPFGDASFDAVMCVNVLEAVPNKARALSEMHRVLKPGGRILLAHDDYESQSYVTTDRELGRRATLAYASATLPGYPTSDGQMGRRLWSLFLRTNFGERQLHVLPLVNTEYRQSLLGWTHAQFAAEFVARVSDLTQAEIDAWHADLAARSLRGEYLYCLNLYVCLGRK